MSENPGSGYQISEVRRRLDGNNFDSFYDELSSGLSQENKEDAVDNLQKLGTALVIGEVFDENNVDYVEEGGVATMAYGISEFGPREITNFREISGKPTHDTDKRVRSKDKCDDGRSLESIVEGTLGPENSGGSTIRESYNDEHDGRKITADIEVKEEEYVETDLMRPSERDNTKYSYNKSETLDIPHSDFQIEVPDIRELINEKLVTYEDNGRDKDLDDIRTLLSVAENRHNNDEGSRYSMRRIYDSAAATERSQDLESTLQQAARDIQDDRSVVNTVPSKAYLDTIIYDS